MACIGGYKKWWMVDKSLLAAALDYLKYDSCMVQMKNPDQIAAVDEKIIETHKSGNIDDPTYSSMRSHVTQIADDLAANDYFSSLDGEEPFTILSDSSWDVWLIENEAKYSKNQAKHPNNQASFFARFINCVRQIWVRLVG